MSKEFVIDDTCKISVNVYLNREGNICLGEDEPVSQKTIAFTGVTSTITAEEAVNTENSPAIYNGVSALMWLFSGQDSGNFDPNFKKTSVEVMEDV